MRITAILLIRGHSMCLICTTDTSHYPAVLNHDGYQQAIVGKLILRFV